MMRASLAAALLGLTLLPGCGGGETTPGQPSADERKKLDDIARKRDEEQGVFDTSPDSLVPADEGGVPANGAATVPADARPSANASGNAAK